MPRKVSTVWRKVLTWVGSLNPREKALVFFTVCCLSVVALYTEISAIHLQIAETKRLIAVRTSQLEQLGRVLQRYNSLKQRLEKVQSTFAASQLTFEGVTNQVDKIVRDSIGSDNYDLKKGRSTSQIGFDYEKQEFTLNVKSISLDQLTKLLYQLEQGDKPLYLGKVDIIKSGKDSNFSATLEIFSVRKS